VSRWLIGGLVVVAVVVLVAAFYPSQDRSDRGPLDMVGARLPAVTLAGLHGSALHTVSLTGRPVLVNVWATWCGPCRREMPALTLLSHRMGPGLTVIAIDQGEDARVVSAYAKQFGVDFPIYLDREQRMGTMLHLVGLPSSFFIDRSGVVRDAVDGEMTYQMMTQKAQHLVAGG
jgi:cytochrome c biogenesis protein CcmG, thiol:disulfide interchange protein DsbE